MSDHPLLRESLSIEMEATIYEAVHAEISRVYASHGDLTGESIEADWDPMTQRVVGETVRRISQQIAGMMAERIESASQEPSASQMDHALDDWRDRFLNEETRHTRW